VSTDSPDRYQTRESIFLRLKQSDARPREIAWGQFRDRYAPVIAGFARNLGAAPQDVDDVVQDVLVGVFQVCPTFVYEASRGRFRGYLKTCTVHALNRRRRENRRYVAIPEDVDPADTRVEETWNDEWERQLLARAVARVRRAYRNNRTFQAFERTALKGQPPADVAAELSMSLDSVYQARTRLMAPSRSRFAR
jgi:RNA polymerase sigma-70 factor (ECF subfamily)